MKIQELLWLNDRIEHIARHSVSPEEVEEVCFGQPFVQRAKSEGTNPVYYVLGQTDAGQYLFCVVIQFPDGKGYPVTARPMTDKAPLQTMEEEMSARKLLQTDSLQELAQFWDTHDITDFAAELKEVTEPVFERDVAVTVHLSSQEAETIKRIAASRGIDYADLIHAWVVEKAQGFMLPHANK